MKFYRLFAIAKKEGIQIKRDKIFHIECKIYVDLKNNKYKNNFS